jgi:hypothetical protein
MTAPITPNRTYTFTRDTDRTCHVSWTDTWYCRFDRVARSCSASIRTVDNWLGLGPVSYTQQTVGTNGQVTDTTVPVDMYRNGAGTVTASAVGPAAVGLSASLTYTDAGETSHGKFKVGQKFFEFIEDVGYEVLHDSVTSSTWSVPVFPDDPAKPDPATVLGVNPVLCALPGDFRRPKWARATAALSNDELFAVNLVASRHDLTGPQFTAILLELTGARRTAYHPDGFYGAANLSTALLHQWLLNSAGQLGGIRSIPDYMSASTYRQLMVADDCLTANLGGQAGVIPVYWLLATGNVPANAGPATALPSPLPARLQPLVTDGNPPSGAHIAARIDQRVQQITSEFNQRLPALCSPPPAATRLLPGQALFPGQSIQSPDGNTRLIYQIDGNLVVYDAADKPLWASATAGTAPGVTAMQADGNLVVYNAGNQALWASHTENHPGAWLGVQNAGFPAVFAAGTTTQLWRT